MNATPNAVREIERIIKHYQDRERKSEKLGLGKYSPLNPSHMYIIQSRQRTLAALLRDCGFRSIRGLKVMEVGCGKGDGMEDFLGQRVDAHHLSGCELMHSRLGEAAARFPGINLACADGQRLPYRDQFFDVVFQYTLFSSILVDEVKREVASEMLRVCKPDGLIVWYDFRMNPFNRSTKGIGKAEIRKLFPGCDFRFYGATLAPPIARLLAPFSYTLASAAEAIHLLNSHFMVAIRPQRS